jgi:hypothetical protein
VSLFLKARLGLRKWGKLKGDFEGIFGFVSVLFTKDHAGYKYYGEDEDKERKPNSEFGFG